MNKLCISILSFLLIVSVSQIEAKNFSDDEVNRTVTSLPMEAVDVQGEKVWITNDFARVIDGKEVLENQPESANSVEVDSNVDIKVKSIRWSRLYTFYVILAVLFVFAVWVLHRRKLRSKQSSAPNTPEVELGWAGWLSSFFAPEST